MVRPANLHHGLGHDRLRAFRSTVRSQSQRVFGPPVWCSRCRASVRPMVRANSLLRRARPMFRRLFVKRLAWVDVEIANAVPRRRGRDPLTAVTLGTAALRPQAVSAVFTGRLQGAWDKGTTARSGGRGIGAAGEGASAHPSRIGITNSLFAADEDIAGIMDALRWKSPKIPQLKPDFGGGVWCCRPLPSKLK